MTTIARGITLLVVAVVVGTAARARADWPAVPPPLAPPAGRVVHVSTEEALQQAVRALRSNTTIVIAPGRSALTQTLVVNGPLHDVGPRAPHVYNVHLINGGEQDLATAGAGSPFYRIPALTVTRMGTLLAAYDARPTLKDLPGRIRIVLRRSTDNGVTWGPQTVVREGASAEGFGDPSLLVDATTGRIFLFHAAGINQGFFTAKPGNRHDDPDVLHADYSWSDDDGLTWTHRRITSAIKDPAWGGIFAASGQGIQLRYGPHAGRLVQQYVVRHDNAVWAASAFSDDHGETWRMGALVGPGADENKTVELSDGRLMLNSRAKPFRKIAFSSDGGATWTGWRDEPQLVNPANNGSIIRAHPDAAAGSAAARALLFSNTESRDRRQNLVIKRSCDDGATWASRFVVESGGASYSTLARLTDGRFGLLYERGEVSAIVFAVLDMRVLGTCP